MKIKHLTLGLLACLVIQTTKAQQDTTTSIYDINLEDLMNIKITSASKKAENIFDSPLSTTVLTRQEIIASGATTIGEALRLAPGIIVREETNGNYDVHIRGFDNVQPNPMLNNTENTLSLVMIDNRIVYSYFQGGTFWETFPIDINDLDRIEIIRGPSTALYGPNAVNGVIHIFTKRGGDKTAVNGHFEGGSYSSLNGQLNAFIPVMKKLTVGVSGNYQVRNNYTSTFYVDKMNGYYTLPELDTLSKTAKLPYPPFTVTKTPILNGGSDKYYPGGNKALDKYGLNGFISYKENNDVSFDLSLGTQDSKTEMMMMTATAFPSSRISNSRYANFNANIHGLVTHISYTEGEQNLAPGNPDFHYNFNHLEGNIEYDYTFKSLTLRPGISYQSALYDVAEYVDLNQGYFRGEAKLNTLGGTLRGDYKLLNDKLRLITALRVDKYDITDKMYFSYQFISSFKASENHLLRLVYSKANRSPFILSSYADYTVMGIVKLLGDKDLNLVKQNTIELGIRNKWTKNLHTDLDVFYATMNDFNSEKFLGAPMASNMKYVNNAVSANQTGVTLNVIASLTENLEMRIFGTAQSTKMKDYAPDFYKQDSLVSNPNKWTPSFYGGLGINYKFAQKVNCNVNAYYMSKQEIEIYSQNKLTAKSLDPAIILNAKISYKVYKENAVFVNLRNIVSNSQFVYMETPKLSLFGGISVNF